MTGGDDRPARPFAAVLGELNKGKSHGELSVALRDLVAAVEDTGKKGTLTYRLTVAQMKDGQTLIVSDEVIVKAPEHDRKGSIYWADKDHNLVRDNPAQTALNFGPVRAVPDHVDPDTGEIIEETS